MTDSVFSLYIVRCADDTLYTGITTDVRNRIAEHEGGGRGAKYLRGKAPLRLEFTKEVGDRSSASRLEHRVKRLSRSQKEALIHGDGALSALLDSYDSGDSGASGTSGTG